MSVLKRHFSSSSIFVSFFIVMTHNSSLNFKVINFILWPKGSHQSSNFDIFECSCENLPNPTSFSKQQVGFFSIFASLFNVMKYNSSLLFQSNNIYLAQKRPIKEEIFETLSAYVKICHIPYANLETTGQFLSKFCIPLQFHES